MSERTPPTHDLLEWIYDADGQPLAMIVRASYEPEKTQFLTPNSFKQQVGFVRYDAGGQIRRHSHRALERHLVGTSEVLVLKRGRAEIDVYDDAHDLIATRELNVGDVMVMIGGGHGFRMLEDTLFLEIKQGPYTGTDEKELF